MQVVTNTHIERGRGTVGQNRVGSGDTGRPQQAEHEASDQAGDDDDRPHAEGARLGAQRIHEHPGIVQRYTGCDAPHDKSPPGDLMAGNESAAVLQRFGVLAGRSA
ncbi:Uncharacterised protein [Mycobacteroides abscessus subsp. abscessus]|nr:Uncharacterised protein [Mycobacteroides abscessus subsp. abscessus]